MGSRAGPWAQASILLFSGKSLLLNCFLLSTSFFFLMENLFSGFAMIKTREWTEGPRLDGLRCFKIHLSPLTQNTVYRLRVGSSKDITSLDSVAGYPPIPNWDLATKTPKDKNARDYLRQSKESGTNGPCFTRRWRRFLARGQWKRLSGRLIQWTAHWPSSYFMWHSVHKILIENRLVSVTVKNPH